MQRALRATPGKSDQKYVGGTLTEERQTRGLSKLREKVLVQLAGGVLHLWSVSHVLGRPQCELTTKATLNSADAMATESGA